MDERSGDMQDPETIFRAIRANILEDYERDLERRRAEWEHQRAVNDRVGGRSHTVGGPETPRSPNVRSAPAKPGRSSIAYGLAAGVSPRERRARNLLRSRAMSS